MAFNEPNMLYLKSTIKRLLTGLIYCSAGDAHAFLDEFEYSNQQLCLHMTTGYKHYKQHKTQC